MKFCGSSMRINSRNRKDFIWINLQKLSQLINFIKPSEWQVILYRYIQTQFLCSQIINIWIEEMLNIQGRRYFSVGTANWNLPPWFFRFNILECNNQYDIWYDIWYDMCIVDHCIHASDNAYMAWHVDVNNVYGYVF